MEGVGHWEEEGEVEGLEMGEVGGQEGEVGQVEEGDQEEEEVEEHRHLEVALVAREEGRHRMVEEEEDLAQLEGYSQF